MYARRFESRRTGRSGYQPACGNEWVRGVCEKPRIRCPDCAHRPLLPVTDESVRWHLSGQDPSGAPLVMGVYPMLLDETCFFLAVDFDGDAWRDDATAFRDACRKLELPAADAEGIARARSASEAFLLRPLETLPRTRGRFRLNTSLPIPFDNPGRMEVDFVDAEARLVIEIDGSQHLGDAAAYRRDRRKDAVLQENGYLVLRFLAEDLSRDLEGTLDAVLRAMSNRERRSDQEGRMMMRGSSQMACEPPRQTMRP